MYGATMRLLMILGVLLCSMHLAEPASAHASDNGFHLVSDKADGERQEPTSNITHSGHHHCPVAPDLRQTIGDFQAFSSRELLFAAPVAPLSSRAPPPLLDPPLA